MSQSLGELYVNLRAEVGGFVSAMSKAAAEAQKTSKQISRDFSDLGRIASQTFSGFGDLSPAISKLSLAIEAAGSAASTAMKEFTKLGGALGPLASLSAGAATGFVALGVAAAGIAIGTAKSADEMLHLAESSGISVEALSRLSFVGKQYDIDQESITKGLQMMAVQMVKAATAGPGVVTVFDRMQLSVRKNKTELKDAGTMFDEIIARLNTMKDRTAAVGFAREIFGRQTGAAVLRIDTSGLEHWGEVADKIGATITTQMGEASHEFQTALNVIDGSAHGIANRLTADLLPTLNAVIKRMSEAAASGETSFGRDFLSTIEFVVKALAVLGETVLAEFEQIGVAIKYLSAGALTTISMLFNAGRAALHGDVFGFNEAVRQGLSTSGAELDLFLAESKGKWKSYGEFVKEAFSKPAPGKSTAPPPGGNGDLTKPTMIGLAEKDTVADLITKLSKQAAEELSLATAIEKSTSARLLAKAAMDAENTISETRIQLMDREKMVRSQLANAIAEQHPGEVKSYTEELAQIRSFVAELEKNAPRIKASYAEIASGQFAAKAAKDLDDFTSKTDRETAALKQMAAAYEQGPLAVQRAQEAAKIAPLEETRSDFGEMIAGLKKMGAPAADVAKLQIAFDQLGTAIDRAKVSVAAFTAAEISEKIAKEKESLLGEAQAYQVVAAAALKSAADQREAAARAEAIKFGAANPAATQAQLNQVYETALAKLGQQRGETIAAAAAQYDLNASYSQEIEKLQEIKSFLEASGESTIAIDTQIYEARISHLIDYQKQVFDAQNAELLGNAKIYESQIQLTEQWDRAAYSVGSFGDKFRAMVNEIEIQGATFGGKIFETFSKGIDDLSGQIAKFVVTGKSNFRSLLEGITEELLKAQIQWGISKIFGGLFGGPQGRPGSATNNAPGGTPGTFAGPLGIGGAIAGSFGLKLPGAAGGVGPNGSSGSPFYVIISDSSSSQSNPLLTTSSDGGGFPGLGGSSGSGGDYGAWDSGGGDTGAGGVGGFTSMISGVFSKIISSLGSVIGTIGSSIGGLFGAIGGLFAGGGPVTRGVPIIVGEKQAEVFVPNESGTIIPSLGQFTNSTAARVMAAKFASSNFSGLPRREYGGDVTAGMPYLTGESRPEVFMPDSARSGASGGGQGGNHYEFHFHGVTDADSFHRSKGQIQADMQQQMAIAHYRNRS